MDMDYDNDGILEDDIDDGLADDIEAEAEAGMDDILGDELPEEAPGDDEGVLDPDELDAEGLDDGVDDITQYAEILKDAQSLVSDKNVYKTGKFLYKYELPRITSARAAAIQNGAPPLIKLVNPVTGRPLRDPLEIAEEELRQGKLPLMVDRPLPGRAPHKQIIEQRPLSTLII